MWGAAVVMPAAPCFFSRNLVFPEFGRFFRAASPLVTTASGRARCHVWDDRQRAAKQLHNLLKSLGVSFWFSEKDVGLGTPLLRAMDKGLAKSRVGIVLVTLRCCAASQRRASPTKSFRLS
jgi:TIR domain